MRGARHPSYKCNSTFRLPEYHLVHVALITINGFILEVLPTQMRDDSSNVRSTRTAYPKFGHKGSEIKLMRPFWWPRFIQEVSIHWDSSIRKFNDNPKAEIGKQTQRHADAFRIPKNIVTTLRCLAMLARF